MPVRPDPVSSKRIAALKALAHPSRLLLAQNLMHGERCVQDLRDIVGDDISTISKHLSILRGAGVLASEKRGNNVYYTLTCSCFQQFLECIDQICPPPSDPLKAEESCCPQV